MAKQPYLSINLNTGSAQGGPTAAELAERIRDQIGSNHLASGCRLPPVRILALQLGISKNTVQRAYDELVAQGLVVNKRRVGLFLAQPERDIPPAPSAQAAPLELLDLSIAAPFRYGRTTIKDPFIMLSGATIDRDLLPVEQFSACLRSASKDHKGRYADYPDIQGFAPLRKKIAERLERRGIPARAEDVVTTLGSQQSLDLVCRVLPTRKIATENPAYQIGKALFEMNEAKLAGLPLDPFNGIDLDDWEKRIARFGPRLLYLVPSFQNPTGYCYSTTELNRIVAFSAQYGFGIMEDDWGSEVLSFSEFRPSLRAIGGDDVLYVNAFTKKLLPSMRLGYVVGNERTAPILTKSKHVSVLGTPLVIEAALFEFLDRGYYDVHMKQLNAELDQRYKNCLDVLRETMPKGVKWTSPGGGLILWLEIPRSIELEKLSASLQARNVRIMISNPAFMGAPHLHGFRICHSSLKPEAMRQGLEILGEELHKLL